VNLDINVSISQDDKLLLLNNTIKSLKIQLIDFGQIQEEKYKLIFQNIKSTKDILNKICQYSFNTSPNKKLWTTELPSIESGLTIHKNNFLHLSSNNFFLFLQKPGCLSKTGKIMIVDNQSNIIKSKEVKAKKSLNQASFEVSNKHIICLYPKEAVFIYDFSLNLVKSFKLEDGLNYIKIFKNEYAICGCENYRIISYNEENAMFELSSSKRMKLNCKLIHFNDQHLYYYHHDGSLLYIINKNNASSVKNYFDLSCTDANKINTVLKFDKNSQIYYLNSEKDLVEVYDQNGDLMFNFEFKKDKSWFKLLSFTQSNKIVTSFSFVFDDVIIMEYDEI
jgi:hypothetical protein